LDDIEVVPFIQLHIPHLCILHSFSSRSRRRNHSRLSAHHASAMFRPA
jgi:hypothetical protein